MVLVKLSYDGFQNQNLNHNEQNHKLIENHKLMVLVKLSYHGFQNQTQNHNQQNHKLIENH